MRLLIYGMIALVVIAGVVLLIAAAHAGAPHPVGPAHIHPLPLGGTPSIPGTQP